MNRILSPDCYLGVIFHNPKASLWPQVRALLEENAAFVESLPDCTVLAGFTKDPAQVQAAVRVAHIAEGWKKTASFFMYGKPIKSLLAHKWYNCYLGALQCNSILTYCRDERQILEDEGETGNSGAIFAYVHYRGYPEKNFTLTDKWPELNCVVPCVQVFFTWRQGQNPIEQFWASAARMGYTSCPLFNIDNFKLAGDVEARKFTLIGAPAAAK